MGDFAEAIPVLEYIVGKDANLILPGDGIARRTAYARTGDLEKAAISFAPAAQFSTTPETLYNYANYLKLAGTQEEAREWAPEIGGEEEDAAQVHAKSGAAWFRKGKALQNELAA